MMAIHETGHVIGAMATGGIVQKVHLQPLSISRTDVNPNPNRLLVVWAGPVLGTLIPAIAIWGIRIANAAIHRHFMFFSGFCLIANGTYIAAGAFDHVGDCKVMLNEGSPLWTLLMFGAVTVPAGFWQWHHMGSFRKFMSFPNYEFVHPGWPTGALLILAVIQSAAAFS